MINVSENFKKSMVAPVRAFKARANMILESAPDTITTFTHQDAIKTIEVQRVGDTSEFFGFGVCQRLNIHLVDLEDALSFVTKSPVKVHLGVNLPDGTCEYITYPTFFIYERNRKEEEGELSITAYDRLYNAKEYVVADVGIEAPYSIRGFVEAAAAFLGLNGVIYENVPESDPYGFDLYYEKGANLEGTENLRDTLNDVAEATQTVYFIDSQDFLHFKRLEVEGDAVAEITENDYFSFHHRDNRRLKGICHVTELGDNVIAEEAQTGTVQYIRSNPFWENRLDIAEIVNNAFENVRGLRISQFDCKWRGNLPLEIGDKVQLRQLNSDKCVAPAYVFDDVITFDGSYSQETQWKYEASEAETDSNPTSIGDAIGQTIARVDKVNKRIDLIIKDVSGEIGKEFNEKISALEMTAEDIKLSVAELDEKTDAMDNRMSVLELNTDSINASVEMVQTNLNTAMESLGEDIVSLNKKVEASITAEDLKIEVQSALDNGVTKVETTTGFVFDNNGLSISKSDSEINTTISEDGMVVYKNDTAILTADNQGVSAQNLHATTYLIIGNETRFENYTNKDGEVRTGCFWIGE